MKTLLIIIAIVALSSCMQGSYATKEQKQRVRESLKHDYPNRKNRPHFWVIPPMVKDSIPADSIPYGTERFFLVDGEVYHSRWRKPLTWSEIEITGIDSLRVYYLMYHAER